MEARKPLIVNLFAGPGAGKTTAALELTAALKKVGYNAEYVSEYAKELVLENKLDLLKDQRAVTDEQFHRLDRLRGSDVEIVVTDSPVLLGEIYGEDRIDDAYRSKILDYHNSFDNFNLFIKRGKGYQKEGRLQTRAEAVAIDEKVTAMLKEKEIYFGTYSHNTIDATVKKIETTYNRLYAEKEGEAMDKNEKEFEPYMKVEKEGDDYAVTKKTAGEVSFSTSELPDDVREAAIWLIENGYQDQQDVQSAFYNRGSSWASDDRHAEENDNSTIKSVYEKYAGKEKAAAAPAAAENEAVMEQKKEYSALYIPSDAKIKDYDKVALYRIATGDFTGYVFSAPKKMIQENKVKKNGALCDVVVVPAGEKIKLSKRKESASISVEDLQNCFSKSAARRQPTRSSSSEGKEGEAKGKKYVRFYLPTDLRAKTYENVQSYGLDARFGEYAGYYVAIATHSLIPDETLTNKDKTKVAVADKVIVKDNSSFTLKYRGKEVVLSAADFKALAEKALWADKTAAAAAVAEAETKPAEVPENVRRMLNSELEEDIYADGDKQIILNVAADKYMILENQDLFVGEESALLMTDAAKEKVLKKIQAGDPVLFGTKDEAKLAFYGADEALPESIDEKDAAIINKFYKDLVLDYYPTESGALESKKEFAKTYIRTKNWAQYRDYVNDKAYEKSVPYALRDKPIFVGWKFEYFDKNGAPLQKPAKMPYNAKTGGRAMPNNESTWSDFDTVLKGVEKYKLDGVGVMFGKAHLVGIDIDHCIDENGKISDMAKDIIETVNSYTEISPSGTGIHILAYGSIPESRKLPHIEVYDKTRYITLTGHLYEGKLRTMKKVEVTQPALDAVWEKYVAPFKAEAKHQAGTGTKVAPLDIDFAAMKEIFSDAEILEKIDHSPRMKGKWDRLREGFPPYEWNDEKKEFTDNIAKVWYREDGSVDASAIENAFCKMLAFFNATPAQIDRIYRESPLAREKWDRPTAGSTYGRRVIEYAIANTHKRYDVNRNAAKPAAQAKLIKKNTNVNE